MNLDREKPAEKYNFRERIHFIRKLVWVLLILILCGVGLLMLGRMEDTVEGRGAVHGQREYELKSFVRSRIVSLACRPGDTVRKGQLLLELDDRELRETILKTDNQIAELKAEIAVSRAALKALRHDPLPKEYRHTEIALQEYRERESQSKRELAIFETLAKKGVASKLELEQRRMNYINNLTELQKLQSDFTKLRQGFAEDIIAQAEAEIVLKEQRLKSLESERVMLDAHRDDYKITAPENGIVGYIPTKVGIYVEPGLMLAVVVAEGARKFIVYIDEKDIYQVQEGQKVRIRSNQYNYFEYGYFYGKVYAVDELPEIRGRSNCYAVHVFLNHGALPLRVGSTGTADIIVGKDFIFKILAGIH